MIRDERGVSLPELLLVIAIMGLITAFLATAIYQIVDITNRGNNELAVQHDLRNAAVWLNRDVLSASLAKVDSPGDGVYEMTLEVPRLVISDTVVMTATDHIIYTYYAYTYSEEQEKGTLTRYSGDSLLTIARHIVTNPFPPLGTDIHAPDPVTVTLVSLEGNVPVSSTFALKMRAGGTVSVVWEPAPTPCEETIGSLEFDDGEKNIVEWAITNDSSEPTTIQESVIAWPDDAVGENGALNEIKLDEIPIWTISAITSPVTIDSWTGLPEDRTIISTTKMLKLIFANTVITTPTEYSITVIFTNTCTVSFP